jgi:hypothetical protein
VIERLDRNSLQKLLGAWVAAVLLPGIVTVDQPVLLAYVFWGIGFIAALVLFIRIATLTTTTELWPWLVASVLPWIVDLAAPKSLLYLLVLVPATGLFAVWIYRRASAADRLLHEGVPGTGTVIEVIEPRFAGPAVNDGFLHRSVRVSVTRPDKAMAYEAVLRDVFKVDELPKPGDTIALKVDPANAVSIAPLNDIRADEPSEPSEPAEPDTEPEADDE